MIKQVERLQALMFSLPFGVVRQAFELRSNRESGRIDEEKQWLSENGFEEVPANVGDILTQDGREIVSVAGKQYALRPEIHTKRLLEAFEAAKNARNEAETKSVVGTESMSVMICPKCGDALQHARVCPSCASGKLGYRHRYTCVCGGVDLISKEIL